MCWTKSGLSHDTHVVGHDVYPQAAVNLPEGRQVEAGIWHRNGIKIKIDTVDFLGVLVQVAFQANQGLDGHKDGVGKDSLELVGWRVFKGMVTGSNHDDTKCLGRHGYLHK